MNKLSSIMDDSVYLARDYSSIIRWFVNKLKYLTSEWTDLSISEPDTLSLSYIAHIFDMVNYLVDKKYISTIFSKTDSIRFLSYLYKIIGSELYDYESGLIKATVVNKSNELMRINKLDILCITNHHNELFTCIHNYEIPPKTELQIELVRGTPIYYELSKTNFSNGYFVLPDKSINRNSLSILIDGITDIKESDDSLFDEGISFSKHQYGEYQTSIRLSPKAYKSIVNNIIVIYTMNDDYSVAKNSPLSLLNNPYGDYEILTDTTNNLSSITLNEIKMKYYELLRTVNTLYNNDYDVSEFLFGRVDYINYKYITDSKFESGTIDYLSGELRLIYKEIPLSDIIITYNYIYNDDRRSNRIEYTITDSETVIELYKPSDNYQIEPSSLRIESENDYIADSASDGKVKLIKGDTVIKFNFSTSDDNPIIELLKLGEVDYPSYSVSLEFNYVPSSNISISYRYIKDEEVYSVKEYFSIAGTVNYIILDIPEGSELVKSSIVIEDGYNIIKDDNGKLYNYQSDNNILMDSITNKLMINDTKDDVILNKLSVKKINIVAVVYLYQTDISIESIRLDIEESLKKLYSKGTHAPGETIKRLPILLAIENSNPSIKYTNLVQPVLDVAVEENQISEIGSINISFERSDNS